MPDLDQDSLASLIAAELAVAEKVEEAEKTFEPEQARTEEIDVPKEVAGQDLPRNVDSFGIPPVFGLASKPAAQPEVHPEPPAPVVPEVNIASRDTEDAFVPPPAHRAAPLPDPLEEIERLIGPAARVQHNPPAPSPALRSLATPVIPKREPEAAKVSPPSHGANVSSIEEAILAAAATSGAKVEWVESSIAATLPAMDDDIKERAPRGRIMGMGRSIAGPLVATLLLAVAAVGLYTVLGLGSNGTTGPAPLLVADTAPTKEVPAEAPDASEANQSVVFNEISGANTAADEQIVSRDQTDVDAVTAVAANDVNTEGLVNRKVRTVTVRPDGTIVSGSDSLAGSAMLPVDRPTVPNVPGADFSTPELIANADANAAATTSTPAAQTASVPATPTLPPVTPGSTVQAVDMAGNPIRGKTAPVPLSRPANLAPQAAVTTPSAPAAQNTTTTAAATTTLPEPAPTAPQQSAQPVQAAAVTAPEGNPAPAYVQLSSQRSEEAARQTAQQIVNRYGPLFGGASLEVQRVDLGERGIFYRVRVPANSLESAMNICTNVKAAGGDCFTL
ncbi:hypothetical protein VW35_04590 [Devosia soli]|uniref:SPOR domain-containing protein n=2 Tax=Devosia soli TaxID=361041 RepID=A0A0F5LDV5_9HYPH|nr:hypothetical protein VW35_04590 [Devosia soli]